VTAPQHVVVCGAGVIGAAVAYFLSLRGVRQIGRLHRARLV